MTVFIDAEERDRHNLGCGNSHQYSGPHLPSQTVDSQNVAQIQAILANHQKGTGQEDRDFIEQNLRSRRLKLRDIGCSGKSDGPHHREPAKDTTLEKLFAAFQNRLLVLRGHDDVFAGQESSPSSGPGQPQ